jgi:hypothetical protein
MARGETVRAMVTRPSQLAFAEMTQTVAQQPPGSHLRHLTRAALIRAMRTSSR